MGYLIALGAALGGLALRKAGVERADWMACAAAVGLCGVVRWQAGRASGHWEHIACRRSAVVTLAVALAGYAALLLIPLPQGLLRLVSPARAELAQAAGTAWSPLSVTPEETLEHVVRLAAYIVVFLIVREMAARRGGWAAAPVVAVAGVEAALGLWQWSGGAPVRGTYVNRNHFAGLMEMALPLAAMAAVAAMRRRPPRGHSPFGPVLGACGLLALAALMLTASIQSLSRMGFLAALFGLLAACAAATGAGRGRRVKWTAVGVAAALAAAGFLFLPPDQLIARFAELAATQDIPANTRVGIWRETLGLIAAYRWFGCGPGGYESAFARHNTVAPLHTVDFAHNDYLQGLAELGFVGFPLAVALLAAAAGRTAVEAGRATSGRRLLAAGCLGSLGAILLHSTVDFNLYVPANALVATWVAGIGTATAGAWESGCSGTRQRWRM
jgi:O-antigen ligase